MGKVVVLDLILRKCMEERDIKMMEQLILSLSTTPIIIKNIIIIL
jgi:hypothetical protein